jgi:[NiFe] hydrogenase assembly HybE family chaperone
LDEATPAARLEQVFRAIAATRMHGMPLSNPALQVEAVGFRPWQGDSVGVLITPWCMNLVCLPGPGSIGETTGSGTARALTFPSGDYAFFTAQEDSLGSYLTSPLFSPMFEFAEMSQARAVAEAVLNEVFAGEHPPATPPSPSSQELAARLEQPVSRRGFLGALLPNRERD